MVCSKRFSRFLPTYPELEDIVLMAATEMTTEADMDALIAALTEVLQ